MTRNCPKCGNANGPRLRHCFSCGKPLDEWNIASQLDPPSYGTKKEEYYDVPAGFWIRLGAWIVDYVVTTGAVLFVLVVFRTTHFVLWPHFSRAISLAETATYLGILLYHPIAVAVWQTTIGKRLFGLYVLRTDGSRIGTGRALARFLATIVSNLILYIGYLMIGIRRDKRGLHDLICDTKVVKRRR